MPLQQKTTIDAKERWLSYSPGDQQAPMSADDQEREKSKAICKRTIADLESRSSELEDDEKAILANRKEKLQKLEKIPTTTNFAKDQLAIVSGLSKLEEQLATYQLAEKQKREENENRILKLIEEKTEDDKQETAEYQRKLQVLQDNFL